MHMRKGVLWLLPVLALLTISVGAAQAGDNESGFHTSVPAMIAPVAPGVSVKPIITVGETLPGGYTFESIPDGISLKTRGQGRVDLWVNHETSTVPFPFNATTGVGFNDFTNAMVSQLTLNQHSAGVLKGVYAIPSEANYQRFCSNFLAGEEHGFERELLLTNEEATDFVFRTGTAWPAPPSEPPAEQAGVVVAYDIKSRAYKSIYGMGRHNHENSVAIPGYGAPVVVSGDDTFSAPGSQLYMYTADSAAQVWDDDGTLWAFRSDDPAINDYGDLTVGGSVSGEFIEVPEAIAKGPQTPLENWSNTNNVFQFIRLEDMAYDRNDPNVVYMADTGEPRAVADPATGRLRRAVAGTQGPYPNGRIFKLVLDEDDPTEVESLSIVIDADAGGYNNPNVIHQPDNLETTENSLLIQEDPGSHNQGTVYARIWRYDLASGSTTVAARVDQSLVPASPSGAWESSGIVDASEAFGPGAFLVDVQAGTLIVQEEVRGLLTYQREGGQLLLIRIPGA
jgi:hypothetical protein